jgi:hypothetical protein
MTISAAFTVNAVANPAEHHVEHGSTVTLAIVSTVGVDGVEFSIPYCYPSTRSIPALTEGGTPLGASATFAMPSDPADGLGTTFLIKCTVTSGNDIVESQAVVGVVNGYGFLTPVAQETTERSTVHGWQDAVGYSMAGRRWVAIGSETLNAEDHTARVCRSSGAGTTTVTIPLDDTELLPIGWMCVLVRGGSGALTVAPESGSVTIESAGSLLSLAVQYSSATLVKRAANTWYLFGDLA